MLTITREDGRKETWLTTDEAADHVGRCRALHTAGRATITPATIRQWVHRGHLTATIIDGRAMYPLAAISRAELATRDRALRLAGISADNHP